MRKKTVVMSGVALLTLSGLSACGGDNDNNVQLDNRAPVAKSSSVVIGGEGSADEVKQWAPYKDTVAFTDPDGDALTYSVALNSNGDDDKDNPPGKVSIDENTGEFTYIAYRLEPASFTVTASDGEFSADTTVKVESVQGDPYTAEQWHLRNVGQYAYAQTDEALEGFRQYLVDQGRISDDERDTITFPKDASIKGVDMNVLPVQEANITGKGVIVVVADTGMEIRHEDLQANVRPGASLNFVEDAADPTDPTNDQAKTGDHGTSVAGLIAAEAWNGLGGRGVAPEAQLVGMNYLRNQTLEADMLAHGMPIERQTLSASDPVSGFNRSYGYSAPYFIANDPVDLEIQAYPALNLRDGKGALDTKANGNAWSGFNGSTICDAVNPNQFGLGCLDANMDPGNASPYNVSVAAISADGIRSSYSSDGANTFITAPAGEYGFRYPAMLTTDQSSCMQGYASMPAEENLDMLAGYPGYTAAIYPFDAASVSAYNPDCNYTNGFNGTSSASPNTAGVIALITEANPDLNWRQIKRILADTARPVDTDDEPVSIETGNGSWEASQGWIKNAAGYHFNRKYGFGLVDADAAVKMAQSNAPKLGELIDTDWTDAQIESPISIPDNSAKGASHQITVKDNVKIEAIQFRFTVSNEEMKSVSADADEDGKFHASTAGIDLGVEVTSPSGTRAVLLTGKQALLLPNSDSDDNTQIMLDTPMLANAFYGESSAGQWTVRLVDISDKGYALDNAGDIFDGAPLVVENNSVDSTLDGFGVRVIGHK